MIHTMPINQPGGAKLGSCNVVYHVWREEEVKIEPIIPADWHIRMADISLGMFLIFMLIIIGFFDLFIKKQSFPYTSDIPSQTFSQDVFLPNVSKQISVESRLQQKQE